jgi:hypothetical protein
MDFVRANKGTKIAKKNAKEYNRAAEELRSIDSLSWQLGIDFRRLAAYQVVRDQPPIS